MTPKRRPAQRPRKRTATVATAFATVALLGAGAFRGSGGQGPSAPPAAQAAQPPSIPAPAAVGPPAQRVAVAAPLVEDHQVSAPPALPARAAPIVATNTGAPSHRERGDVWSLLDSGRLDEGATRIKRLIAEDPEAAWPRLALGVLYYRRLWRPDSIKQWQLALKQDPEIRHDPQFGAYLCFMLDDAWKAAGVTGLLNQLGTEAVSFLDNCVASAKNPRLRSLASRALDGLRRRGQRLPR